MEIGKHMKRNVISIPENARIWEAARLFVEHHVGLLPVLNEQKKVVGVIGLRDLLSLELPDFLSFIADVDYVHDFGAVESTRPSAELLDRSIQTLMKPAITVTENTGLLRTYALMLQRDLHDMPIVSADDRLVGVASRVDVGTAILAAWKKQVDT